MFDVIHKLINGYDFISKNFEKNGIRWRLFAIYTPSKGIRYESGLQSILHSWDAYAFIYIFESSIYSLINLIDFYNYIHFNKISIKNLTITIYFILFFYYNLLNKIYIFKSFLFNP